MLSIVIFIEILFIQIYSEDTFDCTGYDDDSFHPMYNINDCRYYWHCIYVDTVYMRAVKRLCPAGTEFDVRLNECEISNLVNCVPFKFPPASQTSRSTREYLKVFSRKQWITTTSRPQQFQVLPNNSSQIPPILFIKQLLKNFIALNKHKSSAYIAEPKYDNTTNQIFESTSTTEISQTTATIPRFLTSKLKRRHISHRHNLTLNILTSNEHKIRHFSLSQTHGILIHCNEIRRRQLRDLIFRTTMKTINASSKIFPYDILSLTIFYKFFLIFTKISD